MPLNNSYTIFFEKRFERVLDGLPDDVRKAFDAKMDYFRSNSNHPSLNTKLLMVSIQKLKQLGVDQVFEFYINRKDYRCVFYVIHESKEIIIAFIGNHTQVRNKFYTRPCINQFSQPAKMVIYYLITVSTYY